MIDLVDVIILFLAGIAGGFLAGLLGIGGGVIYVLIFATYLRLLTDVPIPGDVLVKLTIANSVFALIFAGISGSYKQYKIGNFYPKLILFIGIPGVTSAVIATYLLTLTNLYSKEEFAIVFSILLLPIIARMLFKRKNGISKVVIERYPPALFSLIGFVSGAATAISGLGGGFIIVPILNGVLRFPIKKTISISLGVIATVAMGLSLFNIFYFDYSYLEIPYMYGSISFIMVLPVIGGVLLGAPIGVLISQRLPGFALRVFFVLFCVAVIIKLFIDFI